MFTPPPTSAGFGAESMKRILLLVTILTFGSLSVGNSAAMAATGQPPGTILGAAHPTSCPSTTPGGGTCHYVTATAGVAGSTGSATFTAWYRYSTSGGSLVIYRLDFVNRTSRTQSIQNPFAENWRTTDSVDCSDPGGWPVSITTNGGAIYVTCNHYLW